MRLVVEPYRLERLFHLFVVAARPESVVLTFTTRCFPRFFTQLPTLVKYIVIRYQHAVVAVFRLYDDARSALHKHMVL